MEMYGGRSTALEKGEKMLNGNGAGVLTDSDGVFMLPYQWGKDVVLKPLQAKGKGEKEITVYEYLMVEEDPRENDLSSLRESGFCVDYFGIVNVQLDGVHSSPIPCLALFNATEGYNWPCVMDVKIGQQTYDLEATKAKQIYELQKYPFMHLIGFRFIGMILRHMGSVNEPEVVGKDWGKNLELQDCARGFVKFFHDDSRNIIRRVELLALISRLDDLIEWFEKQKCAHFISSSLLIVYDACEVNRPCGASTLSVRMIDFTHTYLQNSTVERNLDEGYLFGLKNIHTSLKELSELDPSGTEEEVAARLRDRKLWCQPS